MPHLRHNRVFLPKLNVQSFTKDIKGMKGRGLLLDGGMGSGNTYNGVKDFLGTTNNVMEGSGLGEGISKKLKSLNVKEFPKMKKPNNIQLKL